jgi:hypothetical protein
LLLCILPVFLKAQEQIHVHVPVQKYDTDYYRIYDDRLVTGLYNATQNYGFSIKQTAVSDLKGKSVMNYNSNAPAVNGLDFAYDKLSLSFSYQTVTPVNSVAEGNSSSGGFGLSFGGDKWQLESTVRFYNWFYDKNTANYDTAFKPGKPYYQVPSMSVSNFKLKFMYFPNHRKYSYDAAYACNERQIKSAGSMVITGNIYYNYLQTDTSIIPYYVRSYYSSNSDINGLSTTALSIGVGVTGTLVIYKRFFLNAIFVLGPELQYDQYSHYFSDTKSSGGYVNWSGDFRLAFGFNGRNFFYIFNSVNDFSDYKNGPVSITGNFNSVSFTIGYRFKVKEPGFMPNLRQTKFYRFFDS